MRTLFARLRDDPGRALVWLGIVLAALVYASSYGNGLTNYDDPWLVRDNWIVHDVSTRSLHSIVFDLGRETRAVLGAEYLPVRDLSIMADVALWGDTYAGFHLTNVVLYALAIYVWFAAFAALGIDRTVCGVAMLLWAVHPVHVESVAWISERKGLLAALLAGAAVLGYSRFRTGRHGVWLVLAVVAATLGVWSKATAAFAIASLAGIELVAPAARASTRRALVGLGAIALAAGLAFVPVLVVASRMDVVGDAASATSGGPLAVVGLFGFYLRLVVMTVPNAVSYPIQSVGPTAFEIALGLAAVVVLVGILATVSISSLRRWRPPAAILVACVLSIVTYFPVSRLVLPVRLVIAADRYMLLPSLGVALAIAVGIRAMRNRRIATALIVAIVAAGSARMLEAQSAWRDAPSLWGRAVESNPQDGVAWSMYAEALLDAGATEASDAAIEQGLRHSSSARLVLRHALQLVRYGQRQAGREAMSRAAESGEPIAMSNLALLLKEDGNEPAALDWARKAVTANPFYANGYRILGKIVLMGNPEEARGAFARAHALEPTNLSNRYNLAIALVALRRYDEAKPHLLACLRDPALAARAQAELTWIAQHGSQP